MKIKRILKNIIRDSLRFILPKLWYIKIRFYLTHGYKLNLDDPKTWNEKIQYRKLNCDNEYLSKFVDKLTVREYVKEMIGEEYLIPLLGYYEKITPEDLEKLPNAFVIKTSNGGGGENVKIVRNKNNIDIEKVCNQFNKYLGIKIGSKIDELYYDIKKPYILVEKLILDEKGTVPEDYKIHCFKNRNNKRIITQVVYGRFDKYRQNFYDENWETTPIVVPVKNIAVKNIEPIMYEKMKELALKISNDFNYVRIDLYNIKEKIYFGEITFCPWNGYKKFISCEEDKKWGEMWELEK